MSVVNNNEALNQEAEKVITLQEFNNRLKEHWKYLLSKSILIIIVTLLFGILGVIYAWLQKPVYKAELTYASATESNNAGVYAGLASQFGLDLGGGATIFEGDNLMQLLKSRLLIERTFLTPIFIEGKNELLINYYIKTRKEEKKEIKNPPEFWFEADYKTGNRAKDSLLKKFSNDIVNAALNIGKVERNIDIVAVSVSDNDEFFAKNFVEQLANNAIQYYVDYKVKKARQNVEILQRQTDSVRSLITGNIMSIAVSNDLNVNPARQVMRVGTQRKQVDVEVNSALYTELVKNLELSRMNLRRETPFIQIIDTPVFPLEKKKLGRLKGGLIFAFLGGFLTVIFFLLKSLFRSNRVLSNN